MPTFCRHNRFVQNCPICREPEAPASARRAPRAASPARSAARAKAPGGARRPAASGVRVRRVTRAADDGFASPLVPGLHASADARRLAGEIAFASGRLGELALTPPGALGEAASAPDREEGLWLAMLVAVLGPLGCSSDPFAGVRRAHVSWAGGDVPGLDGVELGARSAGSPEAARRTLGAYRAWAQRAGSQAAALDGEPAWTPERRFARAFERLGTLPGLSRGVRFDLLVCLGRTGLCDVRPESLHLGDGDPVSLAARRVFGIADRFLLERRAADLADACAVPVEALDLALENLDRAEGDRVTQGAGAEAVDPAVGERVAAALGV